MIRLNYPRQLPGVFAALALALAGPLAAQEDSPAQSLTIELNEASQTDGGCRLTFLVRNAVGADLTALSLETVILTTDGRVERLTLFDFGTIPSMRPRVRQFDLAGLECSNVDQILINGVASCDGVGVDPAMCLSVLGLTSRNDIELIG